jgi:hypothetical protein
MIAIFRGIQLLSSFMAGIHPVRTSAAGPMFGQIALSPSVTTGEGNAT